jgi:hypothetical protein
MKANKGKVRIQAHLVNWGSKNFSFTTTQLVVPSSKQATEQKLLKNVPLVKFPFILSTARRRILLEKLTAPQLVKK